MFQFQYGSIGSKLSISWQHSHDSFNSSMVRLEVVIENFVVIGFHRFNSSMVRLEAAWLTGKPYFCLFQFQYGSIGRRIGMLMPKVTNFVSIPVWFDWKGPGRITRSGLCGFQFQYGSIGRPARYKNYIIAKPFQFQYGSIGSWKNCCPCFWS